VTNVRDMTDLDLVAGAALVLEKADALELSLTQWEREFCTGVRDAFRARATISWRQRKSLRQILDKVRRVLSTRDDLAKRIDEMRKAAT